VIAPQTNRIPVELTSLPQWMTWHYNAEGQKIPSGKSNDPATWKPYSVVADREKKAFVISSTDEFCGIDLDDCLDDGVLADWAKPIVEMFRGVAYGEISPSGTGIKFTTRAKKPDWATCLLVKEDGTSVECYDHTRFWTITGRFFQVGFDAIGEGQSAVSWLCETYLKPIASSKPTETPKPKPAKSAAINPFASTRLIDRAEKYVAAAERPLEGGRNNAAFRLAGGLIAIDEDGARLTLSEVTELAQRWNSTLVKPLPWNEIQAVVKSASENGTPREVKLSTDNALSVADDLVDLSRLLDPSGSLPIEAATVATSSQAITHSAIDLLDAYATKLEANDLPQLLTLSDALNGIEVGPELLCVLGAPPGAGKTTLAMQIAFEIVERNPLTRVVVANAETTFSGLVRRELSRQTGIDGDKIRFGKLDYQERSQVSAVIQSLRESLGKMEFLAEPCSLRQIERLHGSEPGLLIVDYLQKFAPSSSDAKVGITELMKTLRVLTKAGWAVLCLSATRRPTNSKEAQDVSQFCFRDSSEIEFNADSCYILQDAGPNGTDEQLRHVNLVCAKNRHGSKESKGLLFDMKRSEFRQGIDLDGLTDEQAETKPWRKTRGDN
jgi:replicative DNA helicase